MSYRNDDLDYDDILSTTGCDNCLHSIDGKAGDYCEYCGFPTNNDI